MSDPLDKVLGASGDLDLVAAQLDGVRNAFPRRVNADPERVEKGLAGMGFVRARPLNAFQFLEPLVAHATREVWSDHAEFVPDLFCARTAPVVSEPAGDLGNDPQLVARVSRWFGDFAHALHTALAVGHRAFALTPRRCGG